MRNTWYCVQRSELMDMEKSWGLGSLIQATVSWTSQNPVLALVFYVLLGNFVKEPETKLVSDFIDKSNEKQISSAGQEHKLWGSHGESWPVCWFCNSQWWVRGAGCRER